MAIFPLRTTGAPYVLEPTITSTMSDHLIATRALGFVLPGFYWAPPLLDVSITSKGESTRRDWPLNKVLEHLVVVEVKADKNPLLCHVSPILQRLVVWWYQLKSVPISLLAFVVNQARPVQLVIHLFPGLHRLMKQTRDSVHRVLTGIHPWDL